MYVMAAGRQEDLAQSSFDLRGQSSSVTGARYLGRLNACETRIRKMPGGIR